MRFMTYNILFGMRGDTLGQAVLSNLAMHGLRPVLPFGKLPRSLRRRFVAKRSRHVEDALALIAEQSPDVLCLNEVLKGLHSEQLESGLKEQGFKLFAWGASKHHEPPFDINTLIASKLPGEQMELDLPLLAKPGGGGGQCAVLLPEEKLVIAGIHPSIWWDIRRKQLQAVKEFVLRHAAAGLRPLVMGDFNADREEIEAAFTPEVRFKGYAADGAITCPVFNLHFRPQTALDHILFASAADVSVPRTIAGLSDHKAVVAEAWNFGGGQV